MSKLSSTFAALVRRASVSLNLFCERCGKETRWQLTGEDRVYEYYKCTGCGQSKSWAVR